MPINIETLIIHGVAHSIRAMLERGIPVSIVRSPLRCDDMDARDPL